MKPLTRIFGRIVFVRAEFTADGTWCTDVFVWSGGSLKAADRAAAKNNLAAVVLCGYGIVTKSDDAPIVSRVTADSQTFVWSTAEGRTSFVRRERLCPLLEELAGEGIVPAGIFCADSGAEFGNVATAYARQLYNGLRWRGLLRLTAESSAVAQVLVRRAALPVLGGMLCLLAANAEIGRAHV